MALPSSPHSEGGLHWFQHARVERGPSEGARSASTGTNQAAPSLSSAKSIGRQVKCPAPEHDVIKRLRRSDKTPRTCSRYGAPCRSSNHADAIRGSDHTHKGGIACLPMEPLR